MTAKSVMLWRLLLALLLFMSLIAGSVLVAKEEIPVMYPFSEMRHLVVLPVIDSRSDKKQNINLEKQRKLALDILKRKRYEAVASDEAGAIQGLAEEDLKSAKADLIRNIGPRSERWVLVFVIGDLSTKTGFGSSANAQVYSFLFDKEGGKIAWSDLGTERVSVGGGVGFLMKGLSASTAVGVALEKTLDGFPKLPKSK